MQADDGWTILTKDKKPAAHYEHSVAIRKGNADILSDHSFLKEEIKKSSYLIDI
jgi:methionyl aminopeptidase